MKRGIVSVVVAVGTCVAILILGACPFAEAGTQRLLLGASSVGGTYYVWGGGWAKIMMNKLPGVDVSVEVTGGPVTNIQLIQQGAMELGFVTTWLAGEGYYGEGWTKGKKHDEIRAIFPMYSSVLHTYTLQKSPIQTIYDFRDKHISVGAPGSTSDLAGRAALDLLGIKAKISALPTNTAIDALRDGRVDAGFAVTGAPGPFMLDLETTHQVRHIGLADADFAKILSKYPYWAKGVVPKGTYKHQTEDTSVIAFWNFAVADKDLSADLVYRLIKATFENRDALIAVDPTAKSVIPPNIVNSSVPLHAGAVKYYREAGIQIPSKLLPPEAR
jgi:TRAP transporter TAXI family solute receptor